MLRVSNAIETETQLSGGRPPQNKIAPLELAVFFGIKTGKCMLTFGTFGQGAVQTP